LRESPENMSAFGAFQRWNPRARHPVWGPAAPALALLAGALLSAGCGSDETQRTLPPVQVAMNPAVAPVYDDGELTLYEVRLPVALPILAPSAADRDRLAGEPVDPYGRMPWVTLDDVRVQLSWTLTNLDDAPHTVEVLVDPWNEFARYFPGLQLVDADNGEYLPNVSGLDYLYLLAPRSEGERSRLHGVYTFDDMDEMARDFATVMNLIENPPPPLAGAEGDATLVYVNHAFAFQNHSDRDPLVRRWVPEVVPALTGFDVGLRTTEPATIAIELVIELVDRGAGRVETDGGALLEPPARVITVGAAGP